MSLALVMSGGGARSAWQAGFLRGMARLWPQLDLPILTGVSAGAINAAGLAAYTGSLEERAALLQASWAALTLDRVFSVGGLHLGSRALSWTLRLLSGGRRRGPRPRGLVDTAPLRAFLCRRLPCGPGGRLEGVATNLAAGRLEAVALTATSYSTGRSTTWVEGRDIHGWERAHRVGARVELGVQHIMASAALPLLFPAVRVGQDWYGDGGMRLPAPFSPAIHLGAGRSLALSTRYGRSVEEARRPVVEGYPPPAQMAGILLNSIFLDQFDADALRLGRINALLDRLHPDQWGGLRKVDVLVVRPSQDLGQLANEFEARLPGTLRFLTRGLGTRETRSNDMLSLIMFQEDYLDRLLRLGEEDAAAQAEPLAEFLGAPAEEPGHTAGARE